MWYCFRRRYRSSIHELRPSPLASVPVQYDARLMIPDMIVLWSSDSVSYDSTVWAAAWSRASRFSFKANCRFMDFCLSTSHSAHHCFSASASASCLRSFSRAQALLLRHWSSRLFNQGSCEKVSKVVPTVVLHHLAPCSPKSFPRRPIQHQML